MKALFCLGLSFLLATHTTLAQQSTVAEALSDSSQARAQSQEDLRSKIRTAQEHVDSLTLKLNEAQRSNDGSLHISYMAMTGIALAFGAVILLTKSLKVKNVQVLKPVPMESRPAIGNVYSMVVLGLGGLYLINNRSVSLTAEQVSKLQASLAEAKLELSRLVEQVR